MDKKIIGIIATVISALCCGFVALFACVWGGLIASGQPITSTINGVETVQAVEPTIGYALLCLSFLLILVPVAVGFFTLRKKSETAPVSNEPLPPAS